ncbi:hypothetical protein WJX72_000386 [[Myrmecia] bisecta]|uniref:Dioxygenase n=1 Tax=[Myrmecia] bisecta TaxID=41462 RepID=A0AAW1PL09_9CHLO
MHCKDAAATGSSGCGSSRLLGKPLGVKGIANTGVLRWGGKLLALYERDLPYELDEQLRTLGQTDLGGSIKSACRQWGAHYRVETRADGAQRLIGFNATETPQGNRVNFWEYDETFKCLHSTPYLLENGQFGFVHDLVVTPNYYIVLEAPIDMNFKKLLFRYSRGKACLAECLQYSAHKPVKIHLVPRPGTGPSIGQKVVTTQPFFSFQHVNAFEIEEGRRLVIDTVGSQGIDFSANLESGMDCWSTPEGKGIVRRLIVTISSGEVSQEPVLPYRACELPVINPTYTGRPYRHAYLVGSRVTGFESWSPLQGLVKLTRPDSLFGDQAAQEEVWLPGLESYAQEPIFVPRPGSTAEDDGWILTVVYNAATHQSQLVILDARHVSDGPVASLNLLHHIPFGIHGSFTEDLLIGPARAPGRT